MEGFGTTDFDNNNRLITLPAIIISGLHCIYGEPLQLHSLITSALGVVEWYNSRPVHFSPVNEFRYLINRTLDGPPEPVWMFWGRKYYLNSAQVRTSGCPVYHPSHYTDYAVPSAKHRLLSLTNTIQAVAYWRENETFAVEKQLKECKLDVPYEGRLLHGVGELQTAVLVCLACRTV
jgi:hypothetical protein